jgi:hypothetical protein
VDVVRVADMLRRDASVDQPAADARVT